MENKPIKKKSEWIRSIQPGETKVGQFQSYEDLDTMSTLVSRFNQSLGKERGVVLSGKRDWYAKTYTITCRRIMEEDEHEQTDDQG